MLRRMWIFALIFVNLSHGQLLTIEGQKAKFLQLQVKVEFSITIQREEICREANKVDAVLDHFHGIIKIRAHEMKRAVEHKKLEAKALNHSINHCIKGLKILSKNLDLYGLHQCKRMPYHIADNLLEAKKLSMSITEEKTKCVLKYGDEAKKLRLCFEKALCELNTKQLRIFRIIKIKKNTVLANSLKCIQDNYNILINELCMLGCHFEHCVAKKCKIREVTS